MTRRELLALLGAPAAAGGCCLRGYPKPTRFDARDSATPVVPLLEPAATRAHGLSAQVIDVHAHFFNGSDVPVRGFVAECIGHSEDPPLQQLIELAAPLLEALALAAPTAADELRQLRAFDRDVQVQGLSSSDASDRFATLIDAERTLASHRLADLIRGTAIERALLRMKTSPGGPTRRGALSATEIRAIVERTRVPSPGTGVMGFKPAANAVNPPPTTKKRPDLKKLDGVLKDFFDKCAEMDVPVLAHTARTNGRDTYHDEFGGPGGWRTLIDGYAANARVATIDFGHFGGGAWMQDFAVLMQDKYERRLYGDLGYRKELMCPPIPDDPCRDGRYRLREALDVTFKDGKTVADRVMFGTDWLMISLLEGWPDYPALLLESLQAIASPDEVEKIFGLNAISCFNLKV